MAAIYHQSRAQSRLFHLFFTLRDIRRAVVWCFTAAQDHVTIRVALSLQKANLTGLVDPDKAVRHRRCTHGVNRGGQTAVSAVFKTNRHRQARRHLAVSL
ncbi:hypothetical protein D3C71_1779380 [compost metagenome]